MWGVTRGPGVAGLPSLLLFQPLPTETDTCSKASFSAGENERRHLSEHARESFNRGGLSRAAGVSWFSCSRSSYTLSETLSHLLAILQPPGPRPLSPPAACCPLGDSETPGCWYLAVLLPPPTHCPGSPRQALASLHSPSQPWPVTTTVNLTRIIITGGLVKIWLPGLQP